MPDSFTLGGVDYPLDEFNIGDVQKLLPLLSNADIGTVAGMSAMATVIHVAVSKQKPDMTFDRFQQLPGVTITEMQRAFQAIGLKIGYFALKKSEAGGEAKPDPAD